MKKIIISLMILSMLTAKQEDNSVPLSPACFCLIPQLLP